MERFIPLTWAVAKEQAHLYLCCDIDQFIFLRTMLQEVGWWVHRTPLINYKVDGNRVPWPEHGPQRKWELVLYAVKGKKTTTRIYPDVIMTRGDENLGHGAQKPVELFVDLLRRSVKAGDSVLDPFAGTGTIFPAAHQLLCRATGIELDEASYGIALKRLEEL
jgi:DNA modification methylase